MNQNIFNSFMGFKDKLSGHSFDDVLIHRLHEVFLVLKHFWLYWTKIQRRCQEQISFVG